MSNAQGVLIRPIKLKEDKNGFTGDYKVKSTGLYINTTMLHRSDIILLAKVFLPRYTTKPK